MSTLKRKTVQVRSTAGNVLGRLDARGRELAVKTWSSARLAPSGPREVVLAVHWERRGRGWMPYLTVRDPKLLEGVRGFRRAA